MKRRRFTGAVNSKGKTMLSGSMQTAPLNISGILEFAATAHGDREVVSRLIEEPLWRYDWKGVAERSAKAANALAALGVTGGALVSSLAWNTHRHLELFFAVPGMGAVLHTANPRLPDDHIVFTIDDAGSTVLLYDRNMAPIVDRLRPRLPKVRHYVMLTDAPVDGALGYEALIGAASEIYAWPVLDENTAAFLCYTSGTTGNPKGVLYSNRSVVLHAMVAGLSGSLGFSAFDVIMPCQSLYHATAWGLPFAAAINGCKFVLPGDRFDGASLQSLIQSEGVTASGGVPTIWTMYLDHLVRTGETSGPLKRLVIGGSAVPRGMAETFTNQYGVEVRQIWGMTETSPLGVVSSPTPALAELGEDEVHEVIWTRQGRRHFGIELKIVDDQGQPLPSDGQSSGTMLVRGPWVIERYFKQETSAVDAEGWFDTGDIATIDAQGFMRITDRKKDVIKSGGEWISSIDLENIAAGCPGVKVAAVCGVYHPKWEERPILLVEPHDNATLTEAAVLAWLEPQIARWWTPDAVIVGPVPLTATGKIDKKAIRDIHKDILRGA